MKKYIFRKSKWLEEMGDDLWSCTFAWPTEADGLEVRFGSEYETSGTCQSSSGATYFIERDWCEEVDDGVDDEVEDKELTDACRRQLQACVQLDLYWICKSEMGSAKVSYDKPVKDLRRGCWYTSGRYLCVEQNWPIYELAQWEDDEPVNILQLLGIDPQNILSLT